MYAIFENGGRQFKVQEGQEVMIDYREDLEPNSEVIFDKVLAYSTEENVKIGQPLLDGATVKALVVGDYKGPKLTIQWFRRRKNSKKKVGHRQIYTKVKIVKIDA